MAQTRVTVIYHPKFGIDFRVSFYVPGAVDDPTDAVIQAIIAKINACTRAVAIEIEVAVVHSPASSPVIGAAYVSEDKGQFVFTDENGKPHNYKVPGIKASLIDTNKESIKLSDPLVTAYTDAVTTYAFGRGGASVTTLVSGTRRENRKRLKGAPAIA